MCAGTGMGNVWCGVGQGNAHEHGGWVDAMTDRRGKMIGDNRDMQATSGVG